MKNSITIIKIVILSVFTALFFFSIAYVTHPPIPSERVPPPQSIRLIAVGDIMLSRGVGKQINRHNDVTYPFHHSADILKSADITFGNLECAITPGNQTHYSGLRFRADPKAVAGLTYAGFDILSLANNHSPNFGQWGLNNTFSYLNKAGIAYVGAGKNKREAHRSTILWKKNKAIGFLAYTNPDMVPKDYAASALFAGTAMMQIKEMKKDVSDLAKTVDIVIVSMHAGTEYVTVTPNRQQQDFARAAIDAGAHLVIGHHPHVIQRAEKYQHGYIFYSLGNFVFDQMWSKPTQMGLILDVTISPDYTFDFTYHPVRIKSYAQPHPATKDDAEQVISWLNLDQHHRPQIYSKTIPTALLSKK